MSNGIRIRTVRYPDGERKFVITVFLDDEDSSWVEFDEEQFDGLIALCQEKRDGYGEIKERNK